MPDPSPEHRRRAATRRVFIRLCGATLGVGVAAPLDAKFVEPFAVEATRHEVFLPHLPPGLDGMTVAHLTDLHRGPITPDSVIRHAVEITVAAKPDLIALTGDFVSAEPSDATHLAGLLAPLNARYGIWGCLGNHDYHHGPDAVASALLTASQGRITLLRNAGQEIAPGLWAAGIEDTLMGRPDHNRACAHVPGNAAAVFLTHNPVGVFGVASRPWLVLSGHTHGGQILVPGLPAPMPPDMDGFPLSAGWGVFDQARLYVNRGVGMVMAPLRFRCRPEVAFMVLRRGEGTPHPLPGLSGRALKRAMRVARRAAHRLG